MRRNYYNHIIALNILGLSLTAIPTVSFADPIQAQTTAADESKLTKTYVAIIENHLNKNLSIMRTVRILINNYPEHAKYIATASFEVVPTKKKAIIVAAIQAEPAVTYSIVDTSLAHFPESAEMIVQTAMATEPAYINDILELAILRAPGKADNLITSTLRNHPSYSESIIRTVHESSSGTLLSSVIGTLKLLPESASYVIEGIKDFFVNFNSTDSETDISNKQWQLLAVEAQASGVKQEKLQWLVDKGHLEKSELASIYIKELKNE